MMKRFAHRHRRDIIAVSLLFALLILLLLPAITNRLPVLRGDLEFAVFPRLLSVTRSVQAGSLPLWDFTTYAGGRPLYMADDSHLFYLPMLPFYFLADADRSVQPVLVLTLIPYALHLLLGCLGAYLFARLALSLVRPAAFAVALLWSLSPDMTDYFEWLPHTFLYSYLPWTMLAVTCFMRTGRWAWWVTGVVCLTVMGSMGAAIFSVRAYFVIATVAGLLWLFDLRRTRAASDTAGGDTGPDSNARNATRRLLAVAGMFPLSVGMAGIAWAPVFEAIPWVESFAKMDYHSAAAYDLWSSTHPLYLATLFVPDLFGILDSRHAWGIGYASGMLTSSAFVGGLSVMTAVLSALIYWIPRRARNADERRLRTWTLVAAIVFIGFLSAVLGRYTPVLRGLCAVLPWFFRYPHAVYYRFACSWSLVILAGIGIHGLLSMPDFRRTVGRWTTVATCLGLAAIGITLALLLPSSLVQGGGGARVPGYRTLETFGEWKWFLGGPLLYFGLTSLVLLVGFFLLRPVWRGRLLLGGIVAEALGVGVLLFYVSLSGAQKRLPPDYASEPQLARYHTLSESGSYRFASELAALCEDKRIRWCALFVEGGNHAWSLGSRSLFGDHPDKPLAPRIERALKTIREYFENKAHANRRPPAFFANMNVGVLAVDTVQARSSDTTPASGDARPVDLHMFEDVLPYAYTQDRLTPVSDEEQFDRLFFSDFHDAVYVGPEYHPPGRSSPPASGHRFTELQARNPILRIDQRKANRTAIEIRVTVPAMLVLAECWHPGWRACVDGRQVPVERVNYLQQGIWLEAGTHSVELRFFPDSLRYGSIVSTVFWAFFLGITFFHAARKRQ